MYQQIERLKFLLDRCLSSCNVSGSSKQYLKIDNLPRVMGDGASINVNQVSVIVNQLKADLNECAKITEELELIAPNQGLSLPQTTIIFKKNMILDSLNKNGWHQTKTAKELGICRGTMLHFLQTHAPEEWANRQSAWKETR